MVGIVELRVPNLEPLKTHRLEKQGRLKAWANWTRARGLTFSWPFFKSINLSKEKWAYLEFQLLTMSRNSSRVIQTIPKNRPQRFLRHPVSLGRPDRGWLCHTRPNHFIVKSTKRSRWCGVVLPPHHGSP
ncbi:hypothetical protein TNCV_864431 [Trichonephila clavipes]|nr:hypothetical protein TNCV_864431 [Trichonephila clavipes]